jgi:carboxylate-amine ligase
VGPALADMGDRVAVADSIARLSNDGNGAALQRRVHAETGDLAAVVRSAVSRTLDV